MRYLYTYLREKRALALVVTVLVGSVCLYSIAKASVVNIGCADLLIVFARGSSDNPMAENIEFPFEQDFKNKERVPGSFFQAMKTNLDRDYPHVTYKAVSVHNFPNLYNQNGYRAVGIFGPKTINNIFDAEMSWWPLGEYRGSVSDGVEETVGYVSDQINQCPEQNIVLGGYSQGANVIGDALFQFTESERSKIDAVTLFGDPKYIGAEIANNTPIDYLFRPGTKPVAKPWKRGNAELKDRGSLDARVPYVPDDMANKTMSWCFDDDFVCSGGSGILQTVRHFPFDDNNIDKNDLGAGHTRYVDFGAPQAASETEQRLAPKLASIERSRGGRDPEKGLAQPTPTSPENRPIDVMFMINTSYGVDDVIGQLRQNTTEVLPAFTSFFNDVTYGVGDYAETGETDRRVPRVMFDSMLTSNLETVNYAFNRKLAFGSLSGGGIDFPDPHQLAIERGVMATNWRSNATKHLVIITDRPFLESVTYNMCNSDVRIGFGITTPNTCPTDISLETDSSTTHPERCKSPYEVLTQTTCALEMTSPGYRYDVTRSVRDAITFAEAKGIAVTFIVPHDYRPGTDTQSVQMQFRKVAKDTGGLFLEYDAFTRANYTDAVWRILNHHPKKLPLAMLEDFNTLGSIDALTPSAPRSIHTGRPVLFDAGTGGVYEGYLWDFDGDGSWDETTKSPNTEHAYTNPVSAAFATVAAYDEGEETARGILPISVSAGEVYVLTPPLPIEQVVARRQHDGSVLVTWSPRSSDNEVVFVGKPEDEMNPLASAPISSGNIVLAEDEQVGSVINIWVENYDGSSDRQSIEVEPYLAGGSTVEDDIVGEPVEQNNQEPSDKVIQDTESAPNSQFIGTTNQQQNDTSLNVVEDGSATPSNRETYNPQGGAAAQQSTSSSLQGSQPFTQVAGSSIQQGGSFSQAQLAAETIPKATERRDLVTPTLLLLLILAAVTAAYMLWRRMRNNEEATVKVEEPDVIPEAETTAMLTTAATSIPAKKKTKKSTKKKGRKRR